LLLCNFQAKEIAFSLRIDISFACFFKDQALMQRSLRAFAEKSPTLASKLGITSNHKISRNATQHLETVDSGSDSEGETKNKSKYFKAREKERELQRQKGLFQWQ
jgi:hypothetical protein